MQPSTGRQWKRQPQEDSVFPDLPSIESLPCLSEEVKVGADDEVREEQPEEAAPFDPAWISILQRGQTRRAPWSRHPEGVRASNAIQLFAR